MVTPVDAPAVHANHALHLDGPEGQTVTRSSAARQERGTALLKAKGRDPLAILRDTGGPDLPIHRTGADDPDCENTLATAILKIGRTGVEWSIYDQTSAEPVHSSKAPWG